MNRLVQRLGPSFPADASGELAGLQPLFDRLEQGAAERERERRLPFAEIAQLRTARFGALRLPREGGASLTFRQLYKIVIHLGAADANIAHIFRNHFYVAEQYARRPTDDRSRSWRNAILDGAIIGLANTELGAAIVGNAVPSTKLLPDGEGFRLDGTKYYTTGTLYADYVLVRAATPDERMVSAIIPVERAGIEVIDDWDGAGQRLTASGTTHFRNVRVERDEAIFDAEGVGYGLAYANTQQQLFLTAVNAGIALGILNDGRKLLQGRNRTFYHAAAERPVDDPLLQQVLGEISANAFAAEAAVLAAADPLDAIAGLRDAGGDDPELAHQAALAAAQAKLAVDQLAIRSANLLFELGGASSTKRSSNLDRHWRNARTLASHNPAASKAAAIGAYEALGTRLPAGGFF